MAIAPQALTGTATISGNVTVVQPTGTNLHAVLDLGSVAAVTQSGTWNIGTVTSITNAISANQGTANSSANAWPIIVSDGTHNANVTTRGALEVEGPVGQGSSFAGQPVIVGGVFNTTQPTVTTGQAVIQQHTSRGALMVATGVDTFTVTANAGTNLNTSLLALESGGNLATIAGAIVSQGTALGTIKAPMVQGSVTTAAPTYTTGQISPLSLTTGGGLRIDLKDTVANTNNLNVNLAASAATVTVTATNLSTNIAQINGVTPLMGAGNTGTGSPRVTIATDQAALAAWGLGATGAAVPAGAQYTGLNPQTALPTAATAGNLVGATSDKFGRLVVLPNGMRDLVLPMTQLTLTSTTTETTLIGQVASTFLDILSIVVINTSATASQVDFRDSTAGTVRLSLYVPAGDTRGVVFNSPLPQATVNNNWTAKCGASVASIIITGTYITNK